MLLSTLQCIIASYKSKNPRIFKTIYISHQKDPRA